MRTLTQYEVAWNMYQAKTTMEQIVATIGKHRSTIYRWLRQIKRLGIRQFIRRKRTAKRRRQPRKLSSQLKHLIRELRRRYGWCGQKIQKELRVKHAIYLSLMTIYRVLNEYFKLRKHHQRNRGQASVASAPRQVVQHDSVDLGELYAYTSLDVFTKEPAVVIADNLLSQTAVDVFSVQEAYFGPVELHQSDEGPEFMGDFPAAVVATGARHRYARPYKKNDQAYIENFNRSLRSECVGWGKYQKADKDWLQAKVDGWLEHWLNERWHMGLPDMMTPAQFIQCYNDNQREERKVAFAL